MKLLEEHDINKPPRGFAAMSPERRREVAARGGAAVDKSKRYFSQNPDKARDAGSLGGRNSAISKKAAKQGVVNE